MTKGKFAILSTITVILVVAVAVASVYFFSQPDKVGSESADEFVVMSETAMQEATEEPTEPPTEDVAKKLIEEMTLEEKIAQMIMVSCHEGVNIEAASSYGVGGICLYAQSFEGKTADEVATMIADYNSYSYLPMLISTDEEGGLVNRVSINPELRETPFSSPSELYSEGEMDKIESDTLEKADLLLSLGVNVNLAPVCDVPLSEDNYIYERCFSLNYNETADYVKTVVSCMRVKGIGSVLKHFPGYGGSVDTHESMSYDDREYDDFEMGDFKPFEAGIKAGADCVLVSHNIVSCMDKDMPASLSKPVHDILRDELNFKGVVMTDDLVMEAIKQFTDGENAAVLAVKAGNDMIICEDYRSSVDAIVDAVNNGEIAQSQIDESAYRVLSWKNKLSILY